MTDIPRPPRTPSRTDFEITTEPPDTSLSGEMRELRGVLMNACERMAKLELRILQHELAIRTEEHQAHRAHERLDEQARDIRKLDDRLSALEPAAE
jgi:hypothetical protein